MNISLNKIDSVNAVIKVEVKKADYEEKVDKALRNVRAKANFPGFRKGMVPLGMVKKLHGKTILVEELNKLVSDELHKHIKENNLDTLGEPLPNEEAQKALNLDTQEDFELLYDIALAPEFTITLNKRNKAPYYTVVVDDETLDMQVDSYRANYGIYEKADTIEPRDMVKGTLVELEKSKPKEGGLVVEEAVLIPSYMKDEKIQAKFIGAAKNSTIKFNLSKAYDGAEIEIASLLKIEKDEVKNYTGSFSFKVLEITRYVKAEMDQDFFDRVLGQGVATDEEKFREKVKEQITQQFIPNSNYKFMLDIRAMLDKKVGDLVFPEAFLKRWVAVTQPKKTAEEIEIEFPDTIRELKAHLIREQLLRMSDVKIADEDVKVQARKATRAQLARYGMTSIPDNMLENYATEMLKKEESVRGLIDTALEEKLTEWLKNRITVETKPVSIDEFKKLFG